MIAKVVKTSNRGSKPGERRGGRKPGTPNKATGELRDLAKQYTGEALEALVNVMRSSESDAARVTAIKEIFDRGYGKATTVIGGDPENPLAFVGRVELVPLANGTSRASS